MHTALRPGMLWSFVLFSGAVSACSGTDPGPGAAEGGSAGAPAATGGALPSGGSSAAGSGGVSGSSSGQGGSAFAGSSAGGTSSGGSAGANSDGGTSNGGTSDGGTSNGGAGAGGASGATASGGSGGSGGGSDCPYTGSITYTLARSPNPSAAEQDAYARITAAMDKAIQYYNCYTDITKAINVSYVPSVATADGNINGSLRFGSNTVYMDYRTAMHEISHTVGIGQASNWRSFLANGFFTGERAQAELTAINSTLDTVLYTEVHADNLHFWPYGINQQSEVRSEADLLFHCRMVMAIRADLGLE